MCGAIGIDHAPCIDCDDQAKHPDFRLCFDLGNHRAVSAGVLVAGEADAVSRAFAFHPLVPAGDDRSAFDHRASAAIGEVTQAKADGILSGCNGQFLHERFDGEHVGEGAERAQRRCP